ncbi:MAG: Gldg family protein, partial [Oscillospiraceae bacterium]|nr:Gldg family protein [Oscillospiraceae bacterium]
MKDNNNLSFKQNFQIFNQTHSSKQGIFASLATVLVIIIVILANVIVGQLPTTATQFDLSDNNLYTVSDVSVDYLKKLDKDVDIIVLYLKDKVDGRITKFIDTYVELSDHLSVQYVDPIAYPSLLTTYNTESGSVIVRCEETDRYQTFMLSDVLKVDYYLYYVLGQYIESGFDCEGLLTSAVNYVTEEGSKTVYTTSGHDEPALAESVQTMLSRNRCALSSVNLLVNRSVPADCDLLLIYNPVTDLAAEELAILEEYLDNGGQVVYFPSDTIGSLPRWEAFLALYGMRTTDGYIMEFERQYGSNNYAFSPLVSLESDVAESLDENSTLLLNNAKGIIADGNPKAGTSINAFMATSSSAALLSADGSYKQGNFIIGVVATNASSGSRLTVISAPSLIDEEIVDNYSNIKNIQLFINTITSSFEDLSENISIEPVSLVTEHNSVRAGRFWSLIYIAF